MVVYLDDSGDPGFKVTKGSTPCFVIVLVIFDDDLEAQRCEEAITRLRAALGFKERMEFRFNGSSKDTRLAFLSRVSRFRFRVRAIVMDKRSIYGPELRRSKESFYRYAIKMVLKHSLGTIQEAVLYLDGHGDRLFRRRLTSDLRRELSPPSRGPRIIREIKVVDSKKHNLIQLADMIAGTLRRFAEREKEDASAYRQAIAKRIEEVWDFGRGRQNP